MADADYNAEEAAGMSRCQITTLLLPQVLVTPHWKRGKHHHHHADFEVSETHSATANTFPLIELKKKRAFRKFSYRGIDLDQYVSPNI